MPTAPSKQLDVVPNPHPGRDYEVRLEIPEFTCLCPVTGQPDFATIRITYVPDRHLVELKSIKLYMWSYRDEGAFHEDVTNRILDDFVAVAAPRFIEVIGDWNVRGGIKTVVRATTATATRARTDLEELLHDDDVDPPAVEQALLAVDSDPPEAQGLVELHPPLIRRERREDHLVVPDAPRLVDHAWEQHAADASAPLAALDVDRQVGDVVIGRPRIEAVETGPGDDAPAALGHEHRMALAPCGQPLPPLIRRPELRLEGRDAILDALVVDRRDRRNITLARRASP